MIIDNHVLRQFLVLDVSKHILIVRVKVPGNLWVFLLESNPLILIHGLVNSILQNCQLVSLWYFPLINFGLLLDRRWLHLLRFILLGRWPIV